MTVDGVADVQQLTSMVMNKIGLSADAQRIVLLYEDPGACETEREREIRRFASAFGSALVSADHCVCRPARLCCFYRHDCGIAPRYRCSTTDFEEFLALTELAELPPVDAKVKLVPNLAEGVPPVA